MSDPAVIVSRAACSIACVSVAMAWNAIGHAKVVAEQHERLRKEFWKQSHEQADQNGKQWGFQIRQWEWLRDQILTKSTYRRRTNQPPN